MSNEIDLELEQIKMKRIQQLMAVKDSPTYGIPEGIIHLTDANFDTHLKQYNDIPIFIDYWADWCRPCKLVAPVIDALEKRYRGKMIFAKLDTDRNPHTAQRHRIYSIPTFHIFYQGKIIDAFSGALPGQQFEMKIVNVLNKLKKNIEE